MNWVACRTAIVLAWLAQCIVIPVAAQTASCAKGDFEAVVAATAEALRVLSDERAPAFQEKLRALKDKRGWSHDQFMTQAAPLVQDDKIAEYDQRSAELMSRINNSGAEGAGGGQPDCRLLAELRKSMQTLVETQQAKWAYMFERVEGELAR